MKFENILSELEKVEVNKILDNPVMLEALKKVLLFSVYDNGTLKPGKESEPMQNFALTLQDSAGRNLTDTEIGQILRAKRYAIELLEDGFRSLANFKYVVEKKKKKTNPAR